MASAAIAKLLAGQQDAVLAVKSTDVFSSVAVAVLDRRGYPVADVG
jgi:hypothetical protein